MRQILPGPLPARVRARTDCGQLEIETILDNFSASHLYLELDSSIEVRAKLFILTRIHHATIAIRGRVLRVCSISKQKSRLEIEITSYRFLQMVKEIEAKEMKVVRENVRAFREY